MDWSDRCYTINLSMQCMDVVYVGNEFALVN